MYFNSFDGKLTVAANICRSIFRKFSIYRRLDRLFQPTVFESTVAEQQFQSTVARASTVSNFQSTVAWAFQSTVAFFNLPSLEHVNLPSQILDLPSLEQFQCTVTNFQSTVAWAVSIYGRLKLWTATVDWNYERRSLKLGTATVDWNYERRSLKLGTATVDWNCERRTVYWNYERRSLKLGAATVDWNCERR